MSEKGGKILNNLYNRVDQADYDAMITEALNVLPTKYQKKFIQSILEKDRWDLDGEPAEEEKEEYRNYVSK